MKAPTFKIKHIGINTASEEHAEQLVTQLCDLFDLSRGNENDTHIFAGDIFEVMRNKAIGTHGHIALQTSDVEYAVSYFAEKGIAIKEDSIRRDQNGKITFVYLDIEVGGFAVHLTV